MRIPVLFFDATDRVAIRAFAAVRRTDIAAIVKAHVICVVAIRRSRPIAGVAANIAESTDSVAAITRSRIPDGRCRAKLAGEVHAFVSVVVWVTGKG